MRFRINMTHVIDHNRDAWDRQVDSDNEWTRPVSVDVIARARAGDWSVVLTGYQPTPRDWFPASLQGVHILGLASAGGQQCPQFAAAGAVVTVFDLSPKQLAQDRAVADREGLRLACEQGDMRDLSRFADDSFDLIFHPVSNVFCPDILPVWRECFRVLRPGGSLLSGFMNPDEFIWDYQLKEELGVLKARYRLPYSDLDLEPGERAEIFGADSPYEFSHSMDAQIGGQLAAGFMLAGFYSTPHHASLSAKFGIPGYFATRALKPA